MAQFSRTKTLTDSCTRQDLYDLINTANISGLVAGDLTSPVVGLTVASAVTLPSDQYTWWWDQTEQLLKFPVLSVGASPASFWMAAGPDRWDFPGFNVSAEPIQRGAVVRWSYAAGAGEYDCTPCEPIVSNITGGRTLKATPEARNLYGIAQATIGPGEFGPIMCRGFGHALVHWSSVHGLFNSILNNKHFPLVASSAYTGYLSAPPRTGGPIMNMHHVATGLARPETAGVSVLGPVYCAFPAGQCQGE